MKNIILFLSLTLVFFTFSCSNSPVAPYNTEIEGLSDQNATAETKSLFLYLKEIKGENMLFGQQYFSLTSQINPNDNECLYNQSDCKLAVGSHPAILGVNYYNDSTINRAHIINTFNQGGIVTMHWTIDNPITGGSHHDTSTGTNTVKSILPGGSKHEFYKTTLTELGNFCESLIGNNATLIPVIFRPFHENSSNGTWWSDNYCTPDEYKQLYQFTVHFLRETLGVHNLLFAYAPSKPASFQDNFYEIRYPGDAYTDIIGFDHYGGGNANYTQALVEDCRVVVNFANQRHKIAAITEAGIANGINNIVEKDWFMTYFFNPIYNDPISKQVSYWLTWSNRPPEYWIPLPEFNGNQAQPNFNSFKAFYEHPYTLFLNDLPETVYNH